MVRPSNAPAPAHKKNKNMSPLFSVNLLLKQADDYVATNPRHAVYAIAICVTAFLLAAAI